jgi:hypothetical protein
MMSGASQGRKAVEGNARGSNGRCQELMLSGNEDGSFKERKR